MTSDELRCRVAELLGVERAEDISHLSLEFPRASRLGVARIWYYGGDHIQWRSHDLIFPAAQEEEA